MLIPYIIYFIRISPYDVTLGIPSMEENNFWPLCSSFIWSVFAGCILCYVFNSAFFVKYSKNAPISKDFIKSQKVQGIGVIVVFAVMCILLETQRVYSGLCDVFFKIFYLLSDTQHLAASADLNVEMHIDMVASYFQTAMMPDTQKMLNLLVIYFTYQGMRLLLDSRAREVEMQK